MVFPRPPFSGRAGTEVGVGRELGAFCKAGPPGRARKVGEKAARATDVLAWIEFIYILPFSHEDLR